MALFFLLPLFTGLITGYISKKSADEIAYFVGIFAVISLIISLVLAPWQIQVLLLIVVLIATKKLLQQNEYKLNVVEHYQEKVNSAAQNELVLSQAKFPKKETIPNYRASTHQASDFTSKIIEIKPDKERSLTRKNYQQAKTPELKFRVNSITVKKNQVSVKSNLAESQFFNGDSLYYDDRVFVGKFFS